jgi:proteasome lid subunit RPN8/RPN11
MLLNQGQGCSLALIQASAASLAEEISLIAWRECSTEWGGLLWGRVYTSNQGSLAWIAAMTPGVGSATPVGFQMSPASFGFGQALLRRAGFPPDLREAGLWHSHPRYRAWLSAVDEEYFHLAFPRPEMLSIVTDPLQQDRAVFAKSPTGAKAIPSFIYNDNEFGKVPELEPTLVWQEVKAFGQG